MPRTRDREIDPQLISYCNRTSPRTSTAQFAIFKMNPTVFTLPILHEAVPSVHSPEFRCGCCIACLTRSVSAMTSSRMVEQDMGVSFMMDLPVPWIIFSSDNISLNTLARRSGGNNAAFKCTVHFWIHVHSNLDVLWIECWNLPLNWNRLLYYCMLFGNKDT